MLTFHRLRFQDSLCTAIEVYYKYESNYLLNVRCHIELLVSASLGLNHCSQCMKFKWPKCAFSAHDISSAYLPL